MSDKSTQTAKADGGNVAVAPQTLAKDAKDKKNTDSLLDVFTSEEVKESSAGILCKDLGDVSVYSLLEQTKQVADEIRFGH